MKKLIALLAAALLISSPFAFADETDTSPNTSGDKITIADASNGQQAVDSQSTDVAKSTQKKRHHKKYHHCKRHAKKTPEAQAQNQ